MPRKKKEELEEAVAAEATAEESVAEIPAAEETIEAAAAAPEEKPKKAKKAAKAEEPAEEKKEASKPDGSRGHRANRVGIVTSDKMTNTVVVRVDRLIKHPKYRKYVRRRKKFMAHDELGSSIGDKVLIVETRPLSARKRWRVVEIIHKAEK